MFRARKIILLTAFLIALTLVVTSCGGQGGTQISTQGTGNAQSDKQERPKEKVKYSWVTWAGAEEHAEFKKIIEKVNSESKEYEVSLQNIPADYYKKIQTMIAGGTAPDFMWLSQEYIPAYGSMGALLDITEYAKKDTTVALDDYYKPVLDTAMWQGKLYGLPWISQPVVMFYNKDMFEKAGVGFPNENWKWNDFIEAGKKLTKDTNGDGKADQYGFIVNGWPPIHTWIWTAGGDTIDKDGKVLIDAPESIEGIKMLNDIINKDKISPPKTQIDTVGFDTQFKTGKVAMFMGGACDNFEKDIKTFKVGVSTIPQGKVKATFNWIASSAVSAKVKNPEIAYKALKDITKAIHSWKVPAPVKSKLNDIPNVIPEKKDALPAIKAALESSRGFNNHPKQAEIDTAIWEEIYEHILRGDKDPEACAKDAAKRIRGILGNN